MEKAQRRHSKATIDRVARAVQRRRELVLKISQEDLAREAKVSRSLIQTLEAGDHPLKFQIGKDRAVAKALGWKDDAFDQLIAGPVDPDDLIRDDARPTDLVDELQGRVEELEAQLSILLPMLGLQREELRARAQEHLQALRRSRSSVAGD